MRNRFTAGFVIFSLVLLLVVSLSCAKVPFKIEDVRTGKIGAQEYLNDLTDNIPAVKKAKNEGLIKEIIYSPTEETVRTSLLKLLNEVSKHGELEESVDHLLESNLNTFREQREKGNVAFTILPSTDILFARNYPVCIFAFPYLLEIAQLDGDVENMLFHELQHVQDIYSGINLNEHLFTWRDLRGKEISPKFFETLMELRACHTEVINIFWSYERGDKKYSQNYVAAVAFNYAKRYRDLGTATVTPLEKNIVLAQRRDYKDVIPTYLGEDLRLDFAIEGRKSYLLLKKTD